MNQQFFNFFIGIVVFEKKYKEQKQQLEFGSLTYFFKLSLLS